jgi:hypothetical protein
VDLVDPEDEQQLPRELGMDGPGLLRLERRKGQPPDGGERSAGGRGSLLLLDQGGLVSGSCRLAGRPARRSSSVIGGTLAVLEGSPQPPGSARFGYGRRR